MKNLVHQFRCLEYCSTFWAAEWILHMRWGMGEVEFRFPNHTRQCLAWWDTGRSAQVRGMISSRQNSLWTWDEREDNSSGQGGGRFLALGTKEADCGSGEKEGCSVLKLRAEQPHVLCFGVIKHCCVAMRESKASPFVRKSKFEKQEKYILIILF